MIDHIEKDFTYVVHRFEIDRRTLNKQKKTFTFNEVISIVFNPHKLSIIDKYGKTGHSFYNIQLWCQNMHQVWDLNMTTFYKYHLYNQKCPCCCGSGGQCTCDIFDGPGGIQSSHGTLDALM